MGAAEDHRRKPRARGAWRQDEVQRAVAGAIAGGMPVGRIEFRRDGFSLIALDGTASTSDAADCARRMTEAFGEGGDD